MGTNQFQREYIEYLQERNTELLNKLNHLKENYENKILTKDLNKHYLISALEDMLNVCTTIPEEIDLFFDKMTAAMGAFKNILLRKSEMVQLVEKISKVINPTENIGNELISVDGSSLVKEEISEARIGRKAGTVKVSPMINGHIISTEPKIYLSRVPGIFNSDRKNKTHQLSPIIEASPDTSSDPLNSGSYIFREIKIPLERINLNKMSYSFIREESPKSRFKGPKTWKKSLTSNKCQSSHQKNSFFLENNENLNKKFSMGEVELPHLPENIDPLEGPSWLHEEVSEMNSSSSRFIDYRRRKHRFATVFDKNEDCATYFEKSKKSLEEDSNEFYENHEEEGDKKDLEQSEKRISESSEDFICESFTSECENNNSPKKRKCQNSRRERSKEFHYKNDIEFINDIKKEIPTVYTKNERQINTFPQSGSSDDENNEERFIRQSREDRKRPLKLSINERSMKLSFEKTPTRTEHIEQKTQINERSKSKSRKEKSVKDISENDYIVKLENHVSTEEFKPKKLKTKSPSVKKRSEKIKSKTRSRSPAGFLSEKEGRKKRKAAPSFKLVEPKLGTKLRRS